MLTLGLGIGLTTAAFSLLNAFLFRPLPFPAPDELVNVSEWSPTELCAGCGVGTSLPVYEEWRTVSQSFVALEAAVERPFSVSGGHTGTATRLSGALISAGLFDLLGIPPAMGRVIRQDEDRPGGPPVALIAHSIWQERFRGASLENAIIRLNGVPHTVIGVMPAGFGYPEFAKVWVPLRAAAGEWRLNDRSLGVVGRLRPGGSIERARKEMSAVTAGLAERYPTTHAKWTVRVTSLREDLAGAEVQMFWLLVAVVFVVLLIACVNLAGIGLARAATRERELAVRVAVGARGSDLVRLLLTESLCLATAGGVVGVVLALWSVDIARILLPPDVPFWLRFDLDWRVFTFCGVVTIAAGIASGLLPAWRGARPNLIPALKDGVGASRDGQRLRLYLVGGELALALMLLVAAGLLSRTFARAAAFDPGYDVRGLLQADVGLNAEHYEGEQSAVFANELVERMQRVPEVASAAVSTTHFIAGFGGADRVIEVADGVVPPGASARFAYAVTPKYFGTLGLRILAGRAFDATDRAGRENVAIVNESLASKVWPSTSPLGHRIRLPGGEWRTIVGLVSNVGGSPLAVRNDPPPNVYLPLMQAPGRPIGIHIRAAGPPDLMALRIREAVTSIDPDEPVDSVMSVEDFLAQWILPARLMAVMIGTVATLALLLAAIGLYGVIAYTVGQRTREFGIRMALGATGRHVIGLVLRQGFRVTLAGVALGAAGAGATSGLLRNVLFGTDPLDPLIFIASAGLLMVVMLVATITPARHASRVEPQVALRNE